MPEIYSVEKKVAVESDARAVGVHAARLIARASTARR